MLTTFFVFCLVLGALVGLLAGLLGIGGGLVIVPALVYLLPIAGVEPALVMPVALATSLATIVLTSISAVRAHHKNRNIPWELARQIMLVVAVGALLGAFIADTLSGQTLTYIFATAVSLLAVYMLASIRKPTSRAMPSAFVFQVSGLVTGVMASLMGIAGGAILIPLLSYFGVQMRQSIGVATACGLVVALFGSLGYIITGLEQSALPTWSLGYIYLPALLGISLTSSLFARYGVKLSAKLPVRTLKKGFAVFLILVAIRMAI
ncbi:sulfite exporter TauE/SafE family protein [Thalassotalea euphylliae]|uniref:Probable membrane transporter protein n=1 Tax=Thalassotalea euphylliae TaxID=1655234 RepID=A0A3E0TPQ8_9GAMM|nr:sulfite exporter TauE/SafE family protein [Thalassotalea euphylliae]REL26423.1 sulfite exporter TauE/SafE family protein [Thalassotalea euphylliae]